ncbi:MAG: hypothetical protein Q9181_004293 [Wetmoreana brouardii]
MKDPRQFVPPAGQQWTSLIEIQQRHENKWQQDSHDSRISFFWTEHKFAIGQRAFLLETPNGNVLWDIIALLDKPTIEKINAKGGLKAIVISHPHYYTTYAEWGQTFKCPVYISADDQEWLCRQPPTLETINFIEGPVGTSVEIVPGVKAVKLGGHFPGSLVLHWEKMLLIADTIMTVPSAYTPHPRPPGQTTYVFQWSIPNAIPLPPPTIKKMWQALKPFDFDTSLGAFVGMDVRDKNLKERVWESIKIQVRNEGWDENEVLSVAEEG